MNYNNLYSWNYKYEINSQGVFNEKTLMSFDMYVLLMQEVKSYGMCGGMSQRTGERVLVNGAFCQAQGHLSHQMSEMTKR